LVHPLTLILLDPAHTGHGYATQAVQELLRHCFQDLGVRRVTANCFLAHHASVSFIERRMGRKRRRPSFAVGNWIGKARRSECDGCARVAMPVVD
jgi:GNAT superfamily N-acetyltransferase